MPKGGVALRPSEARMMLRVDDTVERSTDAAVRYLDENGWTILGVRQAQSAESYEEFVPDDGLHDLYREAQEHGVACAITALRSTPKLAATVQPSASSMSG